MPNLPDFVIQVSKQCGEHNAFWGWIDVKTHTSLMYEECKCMYGDTISVNNYLAFSTAFFFYLRLTETLASPAIPRPKRAMVAGSGTAVDW